MSSWTSGVDRVFVYAVTDIDASSWRSELAAAAPDRGSALARLRAAGLRKKDLVDRTGMPTRVHGLGEADWLTDPARVWRRRDDDAGWSPWEAVDPGTSLDWRDSGEARRSR